MCTNNKNVKGTLDIIIMVSAILKNIYLYDMTIDKLLDPTTTLKKLIRKDAKLKAIGPDSSSFTVFNGYFKNNLRSLN